ncbi:MAG: tol-pal system protein YbgF, partial [Pseudomonadota bacterium]
GRLTPLQPENVTRGAPPSVLGEIESANGGGPVSRPIFDSPGGAAARSVGPAVAAAAPVRYEDAIRSIQTGDHATAERQLQGFIAQNDGDPRIGDATYWLAETYRVRGMFREAAQTYASGIRKYPESKRAPDSWMRLGMSLAQLNQVDRACAAFRQVEARFPNAPARVLRETQTQARRAQCPA